MARDKRPEDVRAADHPLKIRWGARLPPRLLQRLYESDASGIHDLALCDEVGMYLFARCRTFHLSHRREVECPACGTIFPATVQDHTDCPGDGCTWYTTAQTYAQSLTNHYASPGRAVSAFERYYERYPTARTYPEKMRLIDQLIHSFHRDERTGRAVKSVASKLLEGNKKAVVRFLDALSSVDGAAKDEWRRAMASTIDAREIGGPH